MPKLKKRPHLDRVKKVLKELDRAASQDHEDACGTDRGALVDRLTLGRGRGLRHAAVLLRAAFSDELAAECEPPASAYRGSLRHPTTDKLRADEAAFRRIMDRLERPVRTVAPSVEPNPTRGNNGELGRLQELHHSLVRMRRSFEAQDGLLEAIGVSSAGMAVDELIRGVKILYGDPDLPDTGPSIAEELGYVKPEPPATRECDHCRCFSQSARPYPGWGVLCWNCWEQGND